jgi:hypothetical protein
VDDQKQPFNRWTIETMDDDSINGAITAQHTLYPYHFAEGLPDLNSLGERDVKVLARTYSRRAGEINVHRGSESADLYEARVQSVTKMLTKCGVPAASIRITDKMPGGEGIRAERAVVVLQRSYEAMTVSDGSTGSGSGGGSSGMPGQSGTASHTEGGSK